MATGRVACNDDTIEVQIILLSKYDKVICTGIYVIESSGPATTLITDTPVFNCPGGNAFSCKRSGHFTNRGYIELR